MAAPGVAEQATGMACMCGETASVVFQGTPYCTAHAIAFLRSAHTTLDRFAQKEQRAMLQELVQAYGYRIISKRPEETSPELRQANVSPQG